MRVGNIYYVDLSPSVGNEIGGIRLCRIEAIYEAEELVRVRPMGIMACGFLKHQERVVSIKRLREKARE